MRCELTALLTCTLCCVPAAIADAATDQERAAARSLANEGMRLRGQGDLAGALDRFDRALVLVDAPTIALRRAECLQQLGRWVEASEAMLAVGRRQLDPRASTAFREAVVRAREQGQALRARLPTLVIRVAGAQGQGVRVTVDGQQVPQALWGVAQPVDPGTRHVAAERAGQKVEQVVEALEGEEQSVELELPHAASDASPAEAPTGERAHAADAGVESNAGSNRTLAWTLVGVGAAGAVAGGVFVGVASAKNGDLKSAGCKDGQCPPDASAELDSYNAFRASAYVSLGVGALGLIGGSVLLLTSEPAPQRAGVHPWIGVAGAGVQGKF